MKKLALCALTVIATAALIACGDDSSSSGDDLVTCKFSIAKDSTSYKSEMKFGGVTQVEEMAVKGDTLITTVTFTGASDSLVNAECEEAKEDAKTSKNETVTCENGVVKSVEVDDSEMKMLKLSLILAISMQEPICDAIDAAKLKPEQLENFVNGFGDGEDDGDDDDASLPEAGDDDGDDDGDAPAATSDDAE